MGVGSAVKLGLSPAKADKSGTLTNHIAHKQNKRLKKLKLKKLKFTTRTRKIKIKINGNDVLILFTSFLICTTIVLHCFFGGERLCQIYYK